MTITEHVRATLSTLIGRVDEEAGRVIADPSVDPVHDLRVAIRRLSQGLRVFGHLLPGREPRRMRRALKPVLDAAARARDMDVMEELLEREGLTKDHPLFGKMLQDRRRGALALTGQIYLLRADDVPLRWVSVLAALPSLDEEASIAARQVLPAAAADFFEAGRKTSQKSDSPERLHALRLSAKRLRYTMELFTPFYGPVLRRRLDQVREVQNLLGKRQDCAVAADYIQPLAPLDSVVEEVLGRVTARGLRIEHDFRRYWHESFDAPGEAEAWRRYLSRRAPVPRSAA